MPEANTMALFALASFVLVIVPGPAVIYILTRSVSQGRTAGLVSSAGVNLGSLVHVLAAVGGLSVILASSAVAFNTIKWAGVAYLAWIGIRTLLATDEVFATPAVAPTSLRRIFTQGVVVNVLNPKIAVFFLAFLPQFIDPTASNPAFQSLVLGLLLIVIGLISDSMYALVGGSIGDALRTRPRFARRTRIGAGLTYLALSGVSAVTGTRAT